METLARTPMSEAVVYLTKARRHRTDWSKRELQYLDRAANLVRKLGTSVETDHGVTDEGEPWFVICDASSDELIVHFCRIRGRYVACAPFLESSLSGHAFADLIERFLDRYATVVVPLSASTNDSILTIRVHETLPKGPGRTAKARGRAESSGWRIENVAPTSPRCKDGKQDVSITPFRSKCVDSRDPRSQGRCE